MNWELAFCLIGKIYNYVLVEYPSARIGIDGIARGEIRVQFNINTSQIDRSGTELGKVISLNVIEIVSMAHPEEWARMVANDVIKAFNERINQLNPSRRSGIHGSGQNLYRS